VRTEVKLNYAKPFSWKYEPWLIPTNVIGDSPSPLTSFTVARGVAPLIQELPGFADLGLAKIPGQIAAWANPSSSDPGRDQCRVNFAIPYPDAEAAVRQLARKLPGFVEKNVGPQYLGDFYYASNQNIVYWTMPFIQPYFRPLTNDSTRFILSGLFQLPSRQSLAPPGLFAQLGIRTNLLYYDYEITHHRLYHGLQLYQLLNMASRRFSQGTNSPAKLWLASVLEELRGKTNAPSETVTEITQSAPNELTLVRKSHLGFTGFELASFAAFLDSPGFPFRYEPPKLMPLPKDKPVTGKANSPPAVPVSGSGRKP
jgi:hypothetical protein